MSAAWIEEARKAEILPWPGALVILGDEPCRVLGHQSGADALNQTPIRLHLWHERTGNGSVVDSDWPVIDLSDPDTLAAFDRRLALRIGMDPSRPVTGTRFFESPTFPRRWILEAGHGLDCAEWPYCAETRDRLLARVRMWASVTV